MTAGVTYSSDNTGAITFLATGIVTCAIQFDVETGFSNNIWDAVDLAANAGLACLFPGGGTTIKNPGCIGGEPGSLGFEASTMTSVPGPVAGAGLPGLIFAGGGLLAWSRRKRKARLV